ncbi:MAG: N4-gp56 family major capsid protein [Magnetococcus sp. DMHC-1]
MPEGMTTYGDINQRTAAWVIKEMLAHAVPRQVLAKFGTGKEVPKNTADTIKFRRPIPFTAATNPLTEGVTPLSQKMQYEDVTVLLRQYGAPVEITDKIKDMAEDPVLKNASELCGQQASTTLETILWGILKAGTNVFYAGTADTSRTDVNDPISLGRQRLITRALRAQYAEPVTKVLRASVEVGTEPVAASYVALGHTDLESDIRNMTGFVSVEKYGQMKTVHENEIGKVETCRYVLSPLLTPFAGAGNSSLNGMLSTSGKVDVYPVVYFGQDAYGKVNLRGENAITPIVVDPGKASKSDPLAQRGYVSWKTWFAAAILNEAWMIRMECGVTANPTGT